MGTDIFISYAREDRDLAARLAAALEAGGCEVWWDRRLELGEQFADVIEEQVDGALRVVVLWSAASVASRWVKAEARAALRADKIIPVLLERVTLPIDFRGLHRAELVGWSGDPDDDRLQGVVAGILREVDQGRAEAGRAERPVPGSTSPARGSRRWLGGALLLAGAAVVVGLLLRPPPEQAGPPGPTAPEVEPVQHDRASPGPGLPEFVTVQPGTFSMGIEGRAADPLHEVTITRPLEVARTEVTQAWWEELTGTRPSLFSDCGGDCPVERVSHFEALVFANRVSEREGLEPCYRLTGCSGELGGGCPQKHCFGDFVCEDVVFHGVECAGFRLPTEAEWEHLAQGHPRSERAREPWSEEKSARREALDELAWWTANSDLRTHPVATRRPDDRGLHDLLGNVAEWTWDESAPYPTDPAHDPVGPPPRRRGATRVYRGGSWSSTELATTCDHRSSASPAARRPYVGFRLVRTADDP